MSTMIYTYEQADPARRYRSMAMVFGLHLLVLYGVVSGTARDALQLIKKPLNAVVIQEVIIPPAPPPPPVKSIRPPDAEQPKVTSPVPVIEPAAPVPEAARPMESPPVAQAPLVKPAFMSEPHVTLAQVSPSADAMKAQVASLEGEYVGKVRALLNASKRYPTGRQASQQRPQGKVKVWFMVARTGSLVDAGVLESSNSNLLDDAALATVRRANYPPFPANTWPGQEQHKFVAELDFSPPSSD
jgi:protein TonB